MIGDALPDTHNVVQCVHRQGVTMFESMKLGL